MALDGTYTGLQASVAAWLHRTDLTAVIPDLIVLAEARIARDLRLRRQVSTSTLTTVGGTRTVSLPSDWLEMENLSLATAIEHNMSAVSVEVLGWEYPTGTYSGEPRVYAIEGDSILLGPTPDAAYTLNILYYARWAALSVTPTNWLLTKHPNIYLFATLAEAGDYIQDAEKTVQWDAKYQQSAKALQDAEDAAMFSGSSLRVRRI